MEKTMLVGMEKSTEFHEKREECIRKKYNADEAPEDALVGERCKQSGESTVQEEQGTDRNDKQVYGLIFTIQMQKIVETLSAVKAPKKDGKGNPYADVVSAHMSIIEAMQTASRKVFKRAFC